MSAMSTDCCYQQVRLAATHENASAVVGEQRGEWSPADFRAIDHGDSASVKLLSVRQDGIVDA